MTNKGQTTKCGLWSRRLAIAVVVFVITVLATPASLRGYRGKVRKVWKERAQAELASRVADTRWLTNEVGLIRGQLAAEPDGDMSWCTRRMVLAKNGDWLVFANVCRKEDRRIDDLFLARGSDGQWYYSTFHFCIGAVVLASIPQPATLVEFRQQCFLQPFDGVSDDCLRETWPQSRP